MKHRIPRRDFLKTAPAAAGLLAYAAQAPAAVRQSGAANASLSDTASIGTMRG